MSTDSIMPPIHPGEVLMLEYLQPLEVTQDARQVVLQVTRRGFRQHHKIEIGIGPCTSPGSRADQRKAPNVGMLPRPCAHCVDHGRLIGYLGSASMSQSRCAVVLVVRSVLSSPAFGRRAWDGLESGRRGRSRWSCRFRCQAGAKLIHRHRQLIHRHRQPPESGHSLGLLAYAPCGTRTRPTGLKVRRSTR